MSCRLAALAGVANPIAISSAVVVRIGNFICAPQLLAILLGGHIMFACIGIALMAGLST